MHVLITNDDGPETGGLGAIYAALKPMAEVSVVVPDRERSVCSHTARLSGPISVTSRNHPDIGQIQVVDGWPADCVRLAIATLLDQPIDWVVSGINRGANIGVDVHYSGTVAAAREAAIQGVPAIAFSQFVRPGEEPDWAAASSLAAGIFAHLTRLGPPKPDYWNVTFPVSSAAVESPAIVMARLSTDALPLRYSTDTPLDSSPAHYRYDGVYLDRRQAAGTDVEAVFNGKVAVTPMTLDTTLHEAMSLPMPPTR